MALTHEEAEKQLDFDHVLLALFASFSQKLDNQRAFVEAWKTAEYFMEHKDTPPDQSLRNKVDPMISWMK